MTRRENLRTLESEVAVLVRRVRHVVSDRARAVHEDLHAGEYAMLAMLRRTGPARASDLAEAFRVDKGSVSRAVHHLVELGLVERTPDPEDRRASLLAATPSALERLDAVASERSARFDEKLSGLSDADVEQLVDLLARYNAALNA